MTFHASFTTLRNMWNDHFVKSSHNSFLPIHNPAASIHTSPCAASRNDNGYQKSKTQWVFTPLGHRFGSTFRPIDLLMGTKSELLDLWAPVCSYLLELWARVCSYLLNLWARICSYNTQTCKSMGFLNLIQPSAIVILFCDFLVNLTFLLLHFLFW